MSSPNRLPVRELAPRTGCFKGARSGTCSHVPDDRLLQNLKTIVNAARAERCIGDASRPLAASVELRYLSLVVEIRQIRT